MRADRLSIGPLGRTAARCARAALALLLMAALAGATLVLLESLVGASSGVTRVFTPAGPPQPSAALTTVTQYIGVESLSKIRRDSGLSATGRYVWSGVWRISEPGDYRVRATTRRAFAMTLDDRAVLRAGEPAAADVPVEVTVPLAVGVHRVSITYDARELDHFELMWSLGDDPPRSFSQADVYTSASSASVARILSPLRWLALLMVASGLIVGLLAAVAWAGTGGYRLALVVVLLVAGVARADGVLSKWNVVPGPSWFVTGQQSFERVAALLHPLTPSIPHYQFGPGGDPYDYMQQARERGRLFSAGLREPLFPFVVKVTLGVLGQADEAGTVTSAAFSWLLVLATYLLGAEAFGPMLGVLAAAGLAVERNVVELGVSGYRDDAFAALVVLLTWATLRVGRRPGAGTATLWGAIAGALCLTRLTALSVVIPMFGLVALGRPGPQRWRAVGFAAGAALLVAGPYLASCWVEYGTPMYAISGLRDYWDPAQGTSQVATGWSSYLFRGVLAAPFTFVDDMYVATAAVLQNKWTGLPALTSPGAITALQLLSFGGLLGWCWSRTGRYLLVAFLTSVAPFVFIYNVKPDGHQYRYSLHAYPFALLAAVWAVYAVATFVFARWTSRPLTGPRLTPRLAWSAGVVAVGWCAVMLLPVGRLREELQVSGRTLVAAGPRDLVFFRQRWDAPTRIGNVTARCAQGRRATLHVPTVPGRSATIVLRMDTCGGEERIDAVLVRVNGVPSGIFTVQHDPVRYGTYEVHVPAAAVQGAISRVELESAEASPRLRLWYAQVITAAS